MPPTFSYLAGGLGLFGLIGLFLAFSSLRARRYRKSVGRGFFALFWLTAAALFATLSVATQGYRALTREEVVARITTRKLGPQSFEARVELPGEEGFRTYALAGDQLYVDARILKWKPIINVFGLHTAYELDRIGGRYLDLEEEKTGERTLHGLGTKKPMDLDLFALRKAHPLLAPLVDAEYGSGTFIAPSDRGRYEIRVSTSGLLVREL